MASERLILLLLACVQFSHIMDFMIIMPLGPVLMRLFSISPQQFSLLVSVYTISAGATGFLGAFFMDRFDRKRALLFLYAGFTLGTFGCAVSPTYEVLLIMRALTGTFGGVISALVLSIVGDIVPEFRRASAMGMIMASFSLASIFGVPFGLYLATSLEWHAPFHFIGGLGIFVWFLILFKLPSLRGHLDTGNIIEKNVLLILKRVISTRARVGALGLMVLLMLGQFTIIPFISPFLVANVGFKESELTYIYLVGGCFTIISSPLIGRWADRLGKRQVFTVFAVLAIIPMFLITHLSQTPIPYVLMVTSFLFVCTSGRMIPAMSMITSTVEPWNRGSFMSVVTSLQQLTAGFASLVAGMVVVKGANGELVHFDRAGYIAIFSSICALILGRKLRPQSAASEKAAVIEEVLI